MKVHLSRSTVADIVCEEEDLRDATVPNNPPKFAFPIDPFVSTMIQLAALLPDSTPPPPDSAKDPDPLSDLRKIQDSGSEFLEVHRNALADHTRYRRQEVERRLSKLENKNSLLQILLRALTDSYGVAICDSSVSVALAVPRGFYSVLTRVGGVFADGAAGTTEPEAEATSKGSTASDAPIAIPDVSQHDEIKKLATKIKSKAIGRPVSYTFVPQRPVELLI